MKEFKFRVWDGEKIISLNLAFDKWFVWIYRSSCSDWWVLEPYFPEVVIMQYTWLQDSYWKDIYEWDLVRILYTDWRSPEFAIETLKNLPLDEYKRKISSIWVVTFYADKYAEWWLDMKWYSESIYQWTHWEKEVIWNIYENPEIFKSI